MSNNWQFDRPTEHAVQYVTFWTIYPVLGKRVHTMHCDSHKPKGVCTWITYTGDQLNGTGTVRANCVYGHREYKLTVVHGKVSVFGLRSDLRKPFKPNTYGTDQEVLDND